MIPEFADSKFESDMSTLDELREAHGLPLEELHRRADATKGKPGDPLTDPFEQLQTAQARKPSTK